MRDISNEASNFIFQILKTSNGKNKLKNFNFNKTIEFYFQIIVYLK